MIGARRAPRASMIFLMDSPGAHRPECAIVTKRGALDAILDHALLRAMPRLTARDFAASAKLHSARAGEKLSQAGDPAATVARFPIRTFARALENCPETCRVVAAYIARGYARLAQLRTLSAERSPRKIAGILLWLHESVGARIPVTQAIVATFAGTTEETVSRVLAPLKRDGVVAYTRAAIEIRDLPRLHRRVEER